MMKRFKIVPLDIEYVAKIREKGVDDFGHKVTEQVATGYGPCRICLQPFVPGKDIRLLLSHSPFTLDNVFNQPGPIFVHKKEVAPYSEVYRFPREIKADKKSFPLSLIGYSSQQKMVFTRLVGNDDVDLLIPAIFEAHREVEYLHARNSEAGCFICQIERISG